MKFSIFLLTIAFLNDAFAKKEITIGALFHGDDELTQRAFKGAVEMINRSANYKFTTIIYNITRTDSFKAQQYVCKLAEQGVLAIFGPGSVETSGIVSSMAERLEIPHIIYHWKSKPLHAQDHTDPKMTLNFYPDAELLSKALSDVLIDYTWKHYAIIYENDENLIRLKDVLQIHQPKADNPTKLMRLDHMKDMEDKKKFGALLKSIPAKNVILDININHTVEFLRQARDVKMLLDYNKYLITNLDTATVDFADLMDELPNSNITTVRLINTESKDAQNLKDIINNFGGEYIEVDQIPLEAALIYDAVHFFYKSLTEFVTNPQEVRTTTRTCKNLKSGSGNSFGFSFLEFMRVREMQGATGHIEFNKAKSDNKFEPRRGSRTEFQFQILEMEDEGWNEIAKWNSTSGVHYLRNEEDADDKIFKAIESKTFKIAIRIEAPFVMHKPLIDGVFYEGNDRYHGYCIELIQKIAHVLKFKYIFEVVPDGKNGNEIQGKPGEWNGLINEIMKGRADLAIADLTITYDRKKVVDFTNPFMTLGIGILYVKPTPKEKNLFSFLDPFTTSVWVYTGLAYLFISILVFLLSRINNDDWESSHPCQQDPEEVESIWNILNCVWLMMGSIMGQGSDILPKGSSTRIVTGLWWFFALIMLASYTANLAAFLTSDRLQSTINGAEDLAKQNEIKYGALRGGSTAKFFQDSNFSIYQRMWAAMETNGDVYMPTSTNEGVTKVEKDKGKYAFFMESVPMEYVVSRHCKLMQVGELLDSKGYGIALPIDSPYRKYFSAQILKLQESGALSVMKEKWWRNDENSCAPIEKPHDDLDIGNVGGVFLVLIGGCLVAFIVACIEFVVNVQNVAIEEKITHWDAFKSELAFAFNFGIVTKPVRSQSGEIVSRKSSTPPRSLKSRSRYGSESRSLKNKSTRSLNFDGSLHEATSKSLLNLH